MALHTTSVFDISPGGSLLCIILLYAVYFYSKQRRFLPLPPGPKKFPLLGNLFNAPKTHYWLDYQRWSKELGTDLLHVSIPGTSIILIHTYETAMELLDRRSSLYSSRPPTPMIDLIEWDFNFALRRYGDDWRAHRRRFHQALRQGEEEKYHEHILEGRDDFLHRLLTDPEDFRWHIRYNAGSVILKITYGLNIEGSGDRYIDLAERAMAPFIAATLPGAFLVDQFPILKYVPAWFPGAGFKRNAAIWAQYSRDMVNSPYEAGKKMIDEGVAIPSIQSTSLSEIDNIQDESVRAYQERVLRRVAGTMYAGGADTTASSMATFFLALALHPAFQRKAQEELDRVLPKGVLPSFDDEDSLPYVTAIVREVFRWRPVVPLGVPHYIEEEDIFDGYRIPANNVVMANIWAMMHDEEVYPNPERFDPDRFIHNGKLDSRVRDPSSAVFGFGRRICPGRYLAYKTAWILIASVLATFEVSKAVDPKTGEEIVPTGEYTSGLIIHPEPFKCRIKPRTVETEKLVRGLNK